MTIIFVNAKGEETARLSQDFFVKSHLVEFDKNNEPRMYLPDWGYELATQENNDVQLSEKAIKYLVLVADNTTSLKGGAKSVAMRMAQFDAMLYKEFSKF